MAFDWTSILTGGAGGLLGVIGNLANVWMTMKQQKQSHEFELAMVPLKLNADIERTKANVALAVEEGAGKAFVASQQADTVTGKEAPWVLNVRAMVRPTSLFLLFCCMVALFTSGQATQDMREYITQNLVTDFSMALAWYFGARASAYVMQGYKSKAGS